MFVGLKVTAFSLDPRDGRAVVLLEHAASGRVFPLWLDDRDAAAIAEAWQGRARSLSPQGLLARVVQTFGASVEHAALVGVVGGIVRARLVLRYGDEPVELEARASDAVAAALEAGAPVVVEEELLEQVAARVRQAEARVLPGPGGAETVFQTPAERWNQLLSHLSSDPQGPLFEA